MSNISDVPFISVSPLSQSGRLRLMHSSTSAISWSVCGWFNQRVQSRGWSTGQGLRIDLNSAGVAGPFNF